MNDDDWLSVGFLFAVVVAVIALALVALLVLGG